MPAKFALASLVLASLSSVVSAASSCVASDANWNLLAFGFNGKDYNAGTQDSWAKGRLNIILSLIYPVSCIDLPSGTATDITTTQGRP
jgi:hypothetical protein